MHFPAGQNCQPWSRINQSTALPTGTYYHIDAHFVYFYGCYLSANWLEHGAAIKGLQYWGE